MTRENPREIAAEVLCRQGKGVFTEDLLEASLAKAGLSPQDRHLCQELVYGVTRWKATLDFLICRKTGGRQQKPMLQNLLRLGLYQIFWLSRIPPHAAVNESVEIANRRGFGPQSGFINAVLRGYLRERDATTVLLDSLQREQPHIGFSHPEWLYKRWAQRWSPEEAVSLLRWNNAPAPVFGRVNKLKTSAAELAMQFQEEKVSVQFVSRPWLDENLVFELTSPPPLNTLRSFAEGKFYVQDPSTLLAVTALGPQPGERVLDMCAAPGGKLLHIAQEMRNQGEVYAYDSVPARLNLVRQNTARLGATAVETIDKLPIDERFDRILVDAPCSNTGVMRRRVDLRWRVSEPEIARLREAQIALLRQAAEMLKPGGTLVYSTCSLEREENQEVLKSFVSGQSALSLRSETELLPFRDKTDGAYVAVLA